VKPLQLLNGVCLVGAIVAIAAQPAWANRAEVTAVQLEPTETGVRVLLETAEEQALQVFTTSYGTTLVADIINAQLRLPDGASFRQDNPAPGIASVTVRSLDANSIRVAMTGVADVPAVEVAQTPQGLTLSLAAEGATAATPAPESTDDQLPSPGVTDPMAEDTIPEADIPQAQIEENAETESGTPPESDTIRIIVTEEQEAEDEGYRVDRATTGTRTETPILEIPQSIQVVPEQVLEDQAVTQVTEALRNVSGVSVSDSSLTIFSDSIRIRGFGNGRDFFRNGIRSYFTGFNLGAEIANLERIEILKGPASVLYGQGEPGGAINFVTQLPLSDPYYAAELSIGNYSFIRPSIDLSGPINADETILYRFNAAYQSSGSFVDRFDSDRFFLAPVLSFELGDNTNLIVEGEYLDDSRPNYTGLPAVGTVLDNPLGDVSRSRYLGDDDRRERIVGSVGYRFQHDFSEDLSLRNAFRYEFFGVDEDAIFTNELLPDNRTVTRGGFRTRGNAQAYTLQTDVVGNLTTGPLDHELVVGLELTRLEQEFALSFADSVPNIDLFNPDYGIPDFDFSLFSLTSDRKNLLGAYIQDLISIGDNVNILLGGRYDLVNQFLDNDTSGESFQQQDTEFSPRVGIVYRPIDPVSLYASYSQSFSPSFDASSRNADSSPFDPTQGEQFEIGVKAELLDNRLLATLAAYNLTRTNVVTADPDRPGFSIQIGEERSRGIELDLIGEPLPGLNIIASYAYTDAEITEDNSGNEGNRPNNVPLHSGSLWATYEIQSGDLQGLGFGAGIFVVGDREGDLANSFELPSYVRTDTAIFYRRDNWKAGLNFKNLFDINYYESASSGTSVYPGIPFTVIGTVGVEF
jgi:iron complex outermembrane recepter protein